MAERSHGNNPEPRVELYTGMDGAGDCARGGFAEPEMLSAESALSGGRDGVQVAKTAMGSGGAPRSEVVLTGDCSLRLLQFILFFMHGSRHRGSIVLKHRDAGRSRIVASKPCFFPRLSGFSFPPPPTFDCPASAQVHGGGWILLCGKRTPKQARQWQHEPVASEIRSLNVT
jgi:hypothetical protein